MDGFDRIYDLHRILKGRKTAITLNDILQKMECSRATFNRVKRHMCDFLGAPIVYHRDLGGYLYDKGSDYELPGLWFSEKELHALLATQSLLNDLSTGLLKEALYPIQERFQQLLKNNAIDPNELTKRIRFLGVGTRLVDNNTFVPIINAALQCQCLEIRYLALHTGKESRRHISPQRIINYRNNWYVDCWCHYRENYRTFAMERIQETKLSELNYQQVDFNHMDDYFQKTYGLYAGGNSEKVVLHFKPDIVRKIISEQWHPLQTSQLLDDGSYLLSLPYNKEQPHELLQDIMALGPQVKIIEPESLQKALLTTLKKTMHQYQPGHYDR